MTKILVTGATGNVSEQVVQGLLAQGANVRAGVRDPGRAARLADAGAEVSRYDHDDPATIAAAFEGIDRAFLFVPFVPGFSALAESALEAAKNANVRHIVKLSAAGADPGADLWVAREHGRADEKVRSSGIGFTVLRPTFFQDNVLTYAMDSLKKEGAFYGASGGQRTSFVSTADIAAVAVEVLMSPESHAGQTYDLTGGEALTGEEVAALLTTVGGRPIRYVDLSLEQFEAGARSQGTPEPYIEAFVGLERVKANGWAEAVSPHVEQVLGRPPERYETFLRRHASRLA